MPLFVEIVQMESASTGSEQFMYRVGQLKEESNAFWDLEFKGYPGLRSVLDIPRLSMNTICCQRLTKSEVHHYYSLMKHVCPLVKDAISFTLITMIMLLDTSNLIEDVVTPLDVIDTSNSSIDSREVSTPSSSEVVDDSNGIVSSASECDNNIPQDKKHRETRETKAPNKEERFKSIKALQKYYVHLLRNRCVHLNIPKLRGMGDTDSDLKRTMLSLKQLAQYVPVLMCTQYH